MKKHFNYAWITIVLCGVLVFAIVNTELPAAAQCQQAKLTYSDAELCDLLGWSVDVDGDWLVSGMAHYDNPTARLVVWQLIGDQWIERDTLYPEKPDVADNEWIEAAISGDVVVGIGWNDYEHQSGFAVVYRRLNGDWIEEQRIEPFPSETTNPYMQYVDISGNFLMLGCPYCAVPSNRGVRVYRYNGAAWTYLQTLPPPESGELGRNISIDGNWAAVLAHDDDAESYAIHLYEYDGQMWVLRQVLQSPAGEEHWYFGLMFDISGDRLIVGSWQNIVRPYECKVRIYRLVDQTWIQETEMTSPDPQRYPGISCFTCLQGDRAVTFTEITDVPDRCIALHSYRYQLDQWEYQGSLHVDCPCGDTWFGVAMALSDRHLAVADIMDDDAAIDAGAVYTFNLDDADCNNNGVCDRIDIADGTSWDIDGNGIPEECDCVGDLNGDRVVNLDDLAQLLSHYAATGDVSYYMGDLDFDGDVDLDDLAEMLSRYGDTCPWPA